LRRPRSGRPDAFGNRPADVLDFEDFVTFGEMLGSESDERMRFDFADGVRSRLLSARRRVAVFARAVIERELRRGRAVAPGSAIIYGTGGLYRAASGQCRTQRDKSRAALSLLLASQRYGVAIDPSELYARGNTYISIYYSLPAGKALDEARAIVESRFENSGG